MEEERKVVNLNIDDILPNRFQPRIKFSEHAINELAESIKLHGVIQPIVVRKISDKYEIIAGERRYKASIMAGKTTIPAIITTLDDRNSAEVALIENVQRQDLTPIEEAISYKKILDMGYINQEELGTKLGKKQSTIANKLRLLNLNDEVQEALMENKISERHARSLLKLNDKQQTLMLNRIINERLTVRKTDEEIAKLLEDSGSQKEIKEEKGDNMNEDILKDFNIPTEPIANDTEKDAMSYEAPKVEPQINEPTMEELLNPNMNPTPVMPQVDVQAEPVEQPVPEPAINPGFMDVDKIQNVAEDIIKEPTPVPMDDLLKVNPAEQPVEPVQEEPVVEDIPTPQGGKFFNMFNFNEPDNTNIEATGANMDFGEPTVNNTFNPLQNNTESTSSMDVSPEPVPVVETPLENSFVEPQPIEQPQIETPAPDVTQPTNNDNLAPFEAPLETNSLTDDNDFNKPEVINQQVSRPYMMDEDVKFDEDGEIEVQLPTNNENIVKVDFKTVINTIRECAATIEKYGYKVETDEIDLANSYEVSFKIEKND